MDNSRRFKVDYESVDKLKQLFEDNNLSGCISTLDSLIKYAEERYSILGQKLLDPSLSEEEIRNVLRKIIVAERKFRHMLDVPGLCVKRSKNEDYTNDKAMLLITIGILHDIGRIDEIIGQDKNSVFKMKVDHAKLGTEYLFNNEIISSNDRIYDFASEELVNKYGDLIRKCILYHGSLVVPDNSFTTQLGKSLMHDIRLIDKSSIMNSFLYEDMETVIGIPLSELTETNISDVTYQELTSNTPVNRKKEGEEYTPNRHFMSHVGFIYDMTDYSLLDEDWVRKYLDWYQPIYEQDVQRKIKILNAANKYMNK